jgi:hypothetical protein
VHEAHESYVKEARRILKIGRDRGPPAFSTTGSPGRAARIIIIIVFAFIDRVATTAAWDQNQSPGLCLYVCVS